MTDYRSLEQALSLGLEAHVFCILKIGRREHLEELAQGRLRFRPLKFYSDIESQGAAHYDGHEGIVSVLQAEYMKLKLSIGGEQIEISSETGLVDQVLVRELRTRLVFCLHAIHTGEWPHSELNADLLPEFRRKMEIPRSMSRYGDHVWVVTDGGKFKARLREAAKKVNFGLHGRLVRYVDFASIHGHVPENLRGFVKSDEYNEEREYRFQLDAPESVADPFILEVSDLRDISMILPLSEVKLDFALGGPP
jgi:hypothetical protein